MLGGGGGQDAGCRKRGINIFSNVRDGWMASNYIFKGSKIVDERK